MDLRLCSCYSSAKVMGNPVDIFLVPDGRGLWMNEKDKEMEKYRLVVAK